MTRGSALENAGGGGPRRGWWRWPAPCDRGPARSSPGHQLFRVAVAEVPLGSGFWAWPSCCGQEEVDSDSVSVGFLSDSGLNPFLSVLPGGPCGFS